jgi:hypothetical protein
LPFFPSCCSRIDRTIRSIWERSGATSVLMLRSSIR